MGQIEQFFANIAPYAQRAAAAVKMPASVIMAQWTVESGKGTSKIAQGGNLGGITHNANSIDGGNAPYQSQSSGLWFAQYGGNLDLFTQDYIRVMNLSYYNGVRGLSSEDATIKALALSPYDAGHYGGTGSELSAIIKQYGLSKYNTGAAPSMETKNFSVQVPQGATPYIVGAALITLALGIMKG